MAKINKRVLIKHAKALNDLDLLDEPVEVKGDVETIKGDFMDAVEEIDDADQLDEIDDDIIDYYESLVDADKGGGDDDGKDDDDDKKDDKKSKRSRSRSRSRGKKEEKPEFPDLEDLEGELEDMDYDGLCDYAEENKIEIDYDAEDDDIIDSILDYWKKEIRKAKRAAKKDKPKDKGRRSRRSRGRGKDKEDDDDKGKGRRRRSSRRGKAKDKPKLPTGLRNGTLPAILYLEIEDGGATWGELAEICAKEKDKDVKAVMGLAMRTVSRNISKRAPIQAIFTGEDETAQFTVVNADDGDDD